MANYNASLSNPNFQIGDKVRIIPNLGSKYTVIILGEEILDQRNQNRIPRLYVKPTKGDPKFISQTINTIKKI